MNAVTVGAMTKDKDSKVLCPILDPANHTSFVVHEEFNHIGIVNVCRSRDVKQ